MHHSSMLKILLRWNFLAVFLGYPILLSLDSSVVRWKFLIFVIQKACLPWVGVKGWVSGMDDSTWRCKSKNLAVMTSADSSLVRLHSTRQFSGVFLMFFLLMNRLSGFLILLEIESLLINSRVNSGKMKVYKNPLQKMWSFWVVTLTMRQKAS